MLPLNQFLMPVLGCLSTFLKFIHKTDNLQPFTCFRLLMTSKLTFERVGPFVKIIIKFILINLR